MTHGPIRVLVADDEPVLRAALADLVSSDDELELVGVARDAEETITLAEQTRPDVALVDVRMPSGGGIRVAEELHLRAPETRVLAHTAVEDHVTVVRMLKGGAIGYLVKGTPPAEILGAIKRASRGQPSVSPEVMSGLVRNLSNQLQLEEEALRAQEVRTRRIARAIQGQGRSTAFQPIMELDGHRLVGMEALARFEQEDPDAEDLDPEEPWTVPRWFREAEAVGLEGELELACARSALAGLVRLPPDAYLSINASHRTAESDALVEVLKTVDASRIVIEITEHEPVEDYDRLINALRRLRQAGTRVAIDDAGAGFASLRHILLIEPEIIKLDISLTNGIDSDAGRRALAAALISFAEEMGMTVVAEGIETEEEHLALQALGVRHGQGYLLGRPAPLPELADA